MEVKTVEVVEEVAKQAFATGDRVEQMCIKCGEERGHIVASISKKGRITRQLSDLRFARSLQERHHAYPHAEDRRAVRYGSHVPPGTDDDASNLWRRRGHRAD
jgi:hypothetical protein